MGCTISGHTYDKPYVSSKPFKMEEDDSKLHRHVIAGWEGYDLYIRLAMFKCTVCGSIYEFYQEGYCASMEKPSEWTLNNGKYRWKEIQ